MSVHTKGKWLGQLEEHRELAQIGLPFPEGEEGSPPACAGIRLMTELLTLVSNKLLVLTDKETPAQAGVSPVARLFYSNLIH